MVEQIQFMKASMKESKQARKNEQERMNKQE